MPSERVGSVVTASPCPHSRRPGDTRPPLSSVPVSPDSPGSPETVGFGQRRPCPRPPCGQQGRGWSLCLPVRLSLPGAWGGGRHSAAASPPDSLCHRCHPGAHTAGPGGQAAPGRGGQGSGLWPRQHPTPVHIRSPSPASCPPDAAVRWLPALCPGHADPRATSGRTSPPARLGTPGTHRVLWTRALPGPACPARLSAAVDSPSAYPALRTLYDRETPEPSPEPHESPAWA